MATFRFKIETTDRVEVTDHALRRYWLRIDPIPDRREVEERIRSEMQRGFWLRRWRMQDGVPVLHCRCSGLIAVVAPQENCWLVITVMEGKRNGSDRRNR